MAIGDLLWACPLCGAAQSIRGRSDGEACTSCHARWRRGPAGSIEATAASGAVERATPAAWLDRLPPLEPSWPVEARAELRRGLPPAPIRYRSEVVGWVERLGDPLPGMLALDAASLRFRAVHGGASTWPLDLLTGLQASSRALQLKVHGADMMQFVFPGGSSRYWERLVMAALSHHWSACGRGPIREFQPRLVGE